MTLTWDFQGTRMMLSCMPSTCWGTASILQTLAETMSSSSLPAQQYLLSLNSTSTATEYFTSSLKRPLLVCGGVYHQKTFW